MGALRGLAGAISDGEALGGRVERESPRGVVSHCITSIGESPRRGPRLLGATAERFLIAVAY